jgi:hypothetical protein
VSAGPQCEAEARRLWDDSRPDEFFFLEVFGSAVVESLVAAVSYRLCAWADEEGLAVLPPYSPGYPEWDVSDQQRLLAVIQGGGRLGRPAEIRALDTGMLVPKKSLLAVFGLTRDVASVRRLTSLVPCETCALPGCRYRRAPHRRSLPSHEAIRRSPPVGERPLVGQPLDDVLRWRPAHSPAGCFCTAESRAHKWGLVLEVLHFALSQGDLGSEAPRAGPGPDPGRMEGRAAAADRREAP